MYGIYALHDRDMVLYLNWQLKEIFSDYRVKTFAWLYLWEGVSL